MKKLNSEPLGWLTTIRTLDDLDRDWKGSTLRSTLSPALFINPVTAEFLDRLEESVNISTQAISALNNKLEPQKKNFKL